MLFWGRSHAPDGRDQTFELDRLGIELVASRGNGHLAVALQRMRGHADERDCMYRKVKFGRIGNAARRRGHATRAVRPAKTEGEIFGLPDFECFDYRGRAPWRPPEP